MKKFLLLSPLFLGVMPAQALTIDPVGYSIDYCEMRESGISQNEAVKNAVFGNFGSDEIPPKVLDDQDLDIALGAYGIKLLCPEFIPSFDK